MPPLVRPNSDLVGFPVLAYKPALALPHLERLCGTQAGCGSNAADNLPPNTWTNGTPGQRAGLNRHGPLWWSNGSGLGWGLCQHHAHLLTLPLLPGSIEASRGEPGPGTDALTPPQHLFPDASGMRLKQPGNSFHPEYVLDAFTLLFFFFFIYPICKRRTR